MKGWGIERTRHLMQPVAQRTSHKEDWKENGGDGRPGPARRACPPAHVHRVMGHLPWPGPHSLLEGGQFGDSMPWDP